HGGPHPFLLAFFFAGATGLAFLAALAFPADFAAFGVAVTALAADALGLADFAPDFRALAPAVLVLLAFAFFGCVFPVGNLSPTVWTALAPASITASAPAATASPIFSRTPLGRFFAMCGCLDRGWDEPPLSDRPRRGPRIRSVID